MLRSAGSLRAHRTEGDGNYAPNLRNLDMVVVDPARMTA